MGGGAPADGWPRKGRGDVVGGIVLGKVQGFLIWFGIIPNQRGSDSGHMLGHIVCNHDVDVDDATAKGVFKGEPPPS